MMGNIESNSDQPDAESEPVRTIESLPRHQSIDPSVEGQVVTDNDGKKLVWTKMPYTLLSFYRHDGPGWDGRWPISEELNVRFDLFVDGNPEQNQMVIREKYPDLEPILNSNLFELKPFKDED